MLCGICCPVFSSLALRRKWVSFGTKDLTHQIINVFFYSRETLPALSLISSEKFTTIAQAENAMKVVFVERNVSFGPVILLLFFLTLFFVGKTRKLLGMHHWIWRDLLHWIEVHPRQDLLQTSRQPNHNHQGELWRLSSLEHQLQRRTRCSNWLCPQLLCHCQLVRNRSISWWVFCSTLLCVWERVLWFWWSCDLGLWDFL